MCRGGQDGIHRRQLLGNEQCHLLHGSALDHHSEIEGSGHEVHRIHLIILIDTLGDGVEALSTLRGDLHLDQRIDTLVGGLVPVDERMIAADDALLLHTLDFCLHSLLILTEDIGDVLCGQT